LLARATDTVADTTVLPQAERLTLLQSLWTAIASPTGDLKAAAELLADFANQQTDPHEQALMRTLPQCLKLLQGLSNADQASVRWVLGPITQGQLLDVARFGQGMQALQTEQELTDYTWQVAGCVGEFWTELCARHLGNFATLPTVALSEMGRRYGMGLQRLNILRDAGDDLSAGRCYLPQDRLAALGLSPAALAQGVKLGDGRTLERVAPLFNEYLDLTQAQLLDGLTYSCALNSRRLRVASALPALIGARTVALLRQAGPQAWCQRVKMPRHEIKALLWRLFWRGASPKALAQEFTRLSAPAAP
jgi:farnesyl-diphosphate farnesyltransferase